MPKYEDCVIYTIRSGDCLYVGSTCNFTRRKHCHKSSSNNENDKAYNTKLYKTIRENDNEWDMQPHKLFPCKNKMEMRIEEERCRVELKANLNSFSCYGLDIENKEKYTNKWLILLDLFINMGMSITGYMLITVVFTNVPQLAAYESYRYPIGYLFGLTSNVSIPIVLKWFQQQITKKLNEAGKK